MSYDEFVARWNQKQVTKYGGQCVALIAEYEAENNLPIVWGDAHTWIDNSIMKQAYDWVVNNPNDPNQLPPRGAIIVWPLPNEHIAFYDHNLSNQMFVSFGQNSGGSEAHFQQHTWAHVAGWYVHKDIMPAPAPPPPPPPPTPPPVYKLPAAPVPIPLAPKHDIINGVKGYGTATDAANRIRPIVDVSPGSYYIFNAYPDKPNLLNISRVNGKPGAWVDITTDIAPPPPPAPEPTPAVAQALTSQDIGTSWLSSYTTFKDEKGNPVNEVYVFMRNWKIQDIEGKTNTTVDMGLYDELEMSGYFYRVNSNSKQIKYYRPANAAEVGRFFGVPQTDENGQAVVVPEAVAYNSNTSVAERKAIGSITAHDRYIIGLGKAKATVTKLESILDSYGPKVMDIVKGRKKKG